MPVTTPLAFTVATEGVALDQVPPAVEEASVVVLPIQAVNVPVIAETVGMAFTVITIFEEAEVQEPAGSSVVKVRVAVPDVPAVGVKITF